MCLYIQRCYKLFCGKRTSQSSFKDEDRTEPLDVWNQVVTFEPKSTVFTSLLRDGECEWRHDCLCSYFLGKMAPRVVKLCFAFIRSIPVVFITAVIGWSYYAYVVQMCICTFSCLCILPLFACDSPSNSSSSSSVMLIGLKTKTPNSHRSHYFLRRQCVQKFNSTLHVAMTQIDTVSQFWFPHIQHSY